jgi:hypothetical protein
MEASGIWAIVLMFVIVLAALWIFFDVLGFAPAGGGSSSH